MSFFPPLSPPSCCIAKLKSFSSLFHSSTVRCRMYMLLSTFLLLAAAAVWRSAVMGAPRLKDKREKLFIVVSLLMPFMIFNASIYLLNSGLGIFSSILFHFRYFFFRGTFASRDLRIFFLTP